MTTKPNIVRGGKAINVGKRLYYIDGKSHERGGVDIGRDLEVEGGEVVEVKNKGLRVYSAQPILNGKSPAQLVMGGIEPDVVFNAQEKFKDINNLNDDGTKKKKIGGEDKQNSDNTYVNRTEYIAPIERTVNGKKWSKLTLEEQFKNRVGYVNGRPIEKGLEIVSPEFDLLTLARSIYTLPANFFKTKEVKDIATNYYRQGNNIVNDAKKTGLINVNSSKAKGRNIVIGDKTFSLRKDFDVPFWAKGQKWYGKNKMDVIVSKGDNGFDWKPINQHGRFTTLEKAGTRRTPLYNDEIGNTPINNLLFYKNYPIIGYGNVTYGEPHIPITGINTIYENINNKNKKRMGGTNDLSDITLLNDLHRRLAKDSRFSGRIKYGFYDGGKGSGGGSGTIIPKEEDYITKTVKDTIYIPITETFNDAFKRARINGDSTFVFNNKLYNTEINDNPNNIEAGNKRIQNIGIIPIEKERKIKVPVNSTININRKRMGGTIKINGNVINKLLFAASSTGDKKKAKLGTGDDNKNKKQYMLIGDEVKPVTIVPSTLDYMLNPRTDFLPTVAQSPNTNDVVKLKKIDTAPYAPYQWDDTQFDITPASIAKAETNRTLRGSLGDNGGYDPIEEGILQIRELGTGKSGTPEGFTWRNYTDPSSDDTIVNRVPRTISAEKRLTDWGFNPNRIYVRKGVYNNDESTLTDNNNVVDTNTTKKSSTKLPRRKVSNPNKSINAAAPSPIKETPISPLATIEPTNIFTAPITKTITAPTYVKSSNNNSDGLFRGSFKNITPEDLIGAGSNLVSSVASYFVGRNRPSIDLIEPSEPIMEQPIRMVTKYNNRPELANIRENVKRSMDAIAFNTSSSRTALQRMQRIRNAGTQAVNESEAKKQNIETQLKNIDAANRQSVRSRNVATYNKYLADKQNIRNKQRLIDAERNTGKLQNNIGLVTNINATLQDLLSRLEQRRKFNNTLGYLQSTAPNVDDRIMRDNNVDFNYLRTIGG